MFTRKTVECPILGSPSEIKNNILPTVLDVLKHYLHLRQLLKSTSKKDPSISDISSILADKIEENWKRASVPTVSRKRVLQLISKHYETYHKLVRYPKSKRNESYNLKVEAFKTDASMLFDISSCKCVTFASCTCEKTQKVPANEQTFLNDQRSSRKMIIGSTDKIETMKLRRIEERKRKEASRIKKYQMSADVPTVSIGYFDGTDEVLITEDQVEDNKKTFEVDISASKPVSPRNQMRRRLPTLARVSDQYGVSDRCVAAIASATLQDFGIVSKEDTSQVIDRSKIRRARRKTRGTLQEHKEEQETLKGIYFDGRKDATLSQVKIGHKYHRQTVAEEHISLIQEPNSIYLGHVTPSSGSAKSVSDSIFKFCSEKSIYLNDLSVIGCDGTAVNTGAKNGVIRLFEQHLHRPLQWFICQLHANELPLRHLFEHLDGVTLGPREFSGPIGKCLKDCENLPLKSFQIITCNLPHVSPDDLSTDQKYLYEMCQAISSGVCSVDLANRNPGKLSHSRWLTMATRVLRLYVGTENPSNNLTDLAEYIVKVYAPVWFKIKSKWSCMDGAQHVFETIVLSRFLPTHLRSVVDPVIQRNAYFSHPESLLLGMLKDERKHIRELALRRILKSRGKSSITAVNVRKFTVPKLNFDAQDYTELIDWQTVKVTEPPILKNLTNEELQFLISNHEVPVFDFPKFPCHTQAVERCVKLVTEASEAVVGPEARDGFIRAKIKSRLIMPIFETKKDYNVA